MKTYPRQQIIRYAGNKARLLEFLIPHITRLLPKKETLLDLFAGTHSVGYALKNRNRIIGNDVQAYSWAIGKGIIESNHSISLESAGREIVSQFRYQKKYNYHLFADTYNGTYFGKNQCEEIDRIKCAIDHAKIPETKKFSYLCCLMYAMSNAASTTGYFAQYLPAKTTRKLKVRNITHAFLKKCSSFALEPGFTRNFSISHDYKELFQKRRLRRYVEAADLVYADPPYSSAQYSRYYHVLETLVKYDYPKVEFKGQYRKDRFFSEFSRESKVAGEFDALFSKVAAFDKKLILSYVNSGSGLLPEKDVVELAQSHFRGVSKPLRRDYTHSMMGNGSPKMVEEFLLVCK